MAATRPGDGDGSPRKMRRLQKDVLALVQACRPRTLRRREQLSTCFAAAHGAYVTWLARVFSSPVDSDTAQLQLVAWRKWRDLEQCGSNGGREAVNTLRAEVLRAMRCVQKDNTRTTGQPMEDASAVAALLLLWMLHANGSLRLEDVVTEIMDLVDNDSEASCLSHAIDVALSRTSVSALAPQDSAFAWSTMTTHGVVRAVLESVAALAFSINDSAEHETAANRLLRRLCSCSSASFSGASLRMIMDLLRPRENSESASASRRNEKVTAVTRSLVHEFLVSISKRDERHDRDTTLAIFQAYRLCLAPSAVVQIFRQLVYESHSVATDTASCFTSSIFELIADFSIHSTEFASHALTLAHQLADDALTQLNASLLLQSLELASAVAASIPEQTAIECYETWFRAHFSAQEESSIRESKPEECNRRCLNAVCSLVASKRQLQFICAFLSEFGHRLAGEASIGTVLCLSSAEQLGVHLRVMKTHQGKYSMEGLIMDFCCQTRSSIHILRAKEEQAATTTVLAASNVDISSANIISVSYPMKTRTLVQGQVAFLRTQGNLSLEVPQWRLFQPQEWKLNILPYCLDLSAHTALQSLQLGTAPDIPLLDQVAFVNELAKRGMVPSKDYSLFLVEAERCAERKKVSVKKTSYKRRRSAIGAELKEAARQLQQHNPTMKKSRASPGSDSFVAKLKMIKSCTANALEAMEITAGDDVDDETPEDPLTKIVWEYGFVQVLDIFTLNQLERFFRYQSSVLHSVRKGDTLAHLIRVGMNQIRWTSAFHPNELNKLYCMCGVLAAMTDTNMVHPAHAWIKTFSQIEENWLKSEIDGPLEQLRCLICSVFLCARGFLPVTTEPYASRLILPPHDSSPGLQMLVWLAIMSQHHGLHRNMYSFTSDHNGNDANQKHWSLQGLLLNSQHILSQQQWCHEFVINYLGMLEKKQAKQIITTEFRVGIEIFIDCDRQSLLVDSLAWVQHEATMIAAVSKNYSFATSEDVSTWLVVAIMDTTQAPKPNKIKISALLLLLNETMHNAQKHRAQAGYSDHFQAQAGNMQRESFLDFVLTTSIQRLDEQYNLDSSGKYEIFSYSLEMLALCLHHQIPKTAHTSTLLQRFLDHVARNTQERMAWGWLRVLFVLSSQAGLLNAEYNISTLTVARQVANSILIQFALEYPRLHQELITNGPLILDTDMHSFFQWLSRICSEFYGENAQIDNEIRNGLQFPDDSVSSILPTVLERVKFKIQVAKSLLDSKMLSCSRGGADQLTRGKTAYLRNLACMVLRDSSSRSQGGNDQCWSGELACWLCQEWMTVSAGPASSNLKTQQEPSPNLLQLLLVHITAELCRQFPGAERKLLQSWTAQSNAKGSTTAAMKAVFIVLAVATIDHHTESQLESVLAMNGSLWMNEFPRMALLLHVSNTKALVSVKANASEGSEANMHLLLSVVCSTASFQAQLGQLLERVLRFGVEKRIDILDASLPSQIIREWPHLECIASRLQILSFTDAASGLLYQ